MVRFVASGVAVDVAGVMKFKEKGVKGLTSGIEMLFKKNKVGSMTCCAALYVLLIVHSVSVDCGSFGV